ncbi:MAG: hypothetical protein OXF88_02185 [Rhodobacteraceae bacterium]|nr:hypothetical protein [Paracoccaceae bacterium]MCY4137749.1 hypothetical protein [Paracoccaceae bacterium]
MAADQGASGAELDDFHLLGIAGKAVLSKGMLEDVDLGMAAATPVLQELDPLALHYPTEGNGKDSFSIIRKSGCRLTRAAGLGRGLMAAHSRRESWFRMALDQAGSQETRSKVRNRASRCVSLM